MPTRIVFTDGVEVWVEPEPVEVRRLLSEDIAVHKEPFTALRKQASSEPVYIAADRVAYFEPVPG